MPNSSAGGCCLISPRRVRDGPTRSEAKPVGLLRVALPLLDHLDPQVQIDRRPEKGLDLGPKWPSASRWANCSPATANATAKVRSYKSSSGVATLCCSYGSRPDMIRRPCACTVRSWSLRLGSGTAMGCCHVVDPPDRRFPDFVTPYAPDPFGLQQLGLIRLVGVHLVRVHPAAHRRRGGPLRGFGGRPSATEPWTTRFFGPGHGMPERTGTIEPRGR